MYRYGTDFERGYRTNRWTGYGRNPTGFGNAGHRGTWNRGFSGYDRDYGNRGFATYGFGYDRDYYGTYGTGYDRDFGKSRWETDYGDPFNDRTRGTPIRVMRGEWHGRDRDRDFGDRDFGDRGFGYDRDYHGTYRTGYDRTYRPRRWHY